MITYIARRVLWIIPVLFTVSIITFMLALSGKLVVKGLYVREHPGPVREGEEGRGEPAVYSASLTGQTMTLTVTLSQTSETVGPFTLTHGKIGRLRKCA